MIQFWRMWNVKWVQKKNEHTKKIEKEFNFFKKLLDTEQDKEMSGIGLILFLFF
jgi:hypothetical protein